MEIGDLNMQVEKMERLYKEKVEASLLKDRQIDQFKGLNNANVVCERGVKEISPSCLCDM